MRIDFECSGGYANLQLSFHRDTAELPPEVAEKLASLVETSRFFDLEGHVMAPPTGGPPDVISYRLSITESARSNSVACNDVTAPEGLRPLLTLLRELALTQRSR